MGRSPDRSASRSSVTNRAGPYKWQPSRRRPWRRRGRFAVSVPRADTMRTRRWSMPIHDWTRVSTGGFHDFHQDWTIEIRRTLNRGLLPPGYAAYTDLKVSGREPEVIAIQSSGSATPGGLAVADAPPRARQVLRVES